MNFEYDPHKSKANKAKHGINFEEAQELWASQALLIPARTTSEPRWVRVAEWEGKLWTAVYTIRANNIRIISVRRARDNEKEQYKNSIERH